MQMLADLRLTRAPSAAFAAMALFWGTLAATVPALKARAGMSDVELGLAILMATVGAAMALFTAGWADRVAGLRATRGAALVLVAAIAGLGFARDPLTLAAALFIGGIGSGLMDVSVNLRIARIEAAEGRGLMSLAHAVYALVYAGAALSAGLARQAGAPLEVTLGAAALAALAMSLLVTGTTGDAEAHDAPGGSGGPLSVSLVVAGGSVLFVGFLAEGAADGWSALHLERSAGAGALAGAMGPVVLGLTLGLGRIAAQAALRWADEARLLALASALAAAGTALAAWAPGLAATYAGFAGMGLGASVLLPMALALIGRGAAPAVRANAIAAASFIGYGAFMVGPPVMGALADWQGLWLSFAWIAASIALVPLVLAPWLARAAARG